MPDNNGPIKPPNLRRGGTGASAVGEANKKKWLVLAVAIAAIAALLIGAYMAFFNKKPMPPEPVPSQTTTASRTPVPSVSTAPATAQGTPTTQPSRSATTTSPTTRTTPVVVDSTDKAQKVADTFIKKIKSGKAGGDLADDMKPFVTNPVYETLKHVDPATIPAAVKASVSADSGSWDVVAEDDKGESLYTFSMSGYAVEGAPTDIAVLVRTVDLPVSNERRMDKDGHPLPAPVPLFNDTMLQSMEQQAYGVAKTYFEYTASDLPEKRTARVKAAVNGGDVPSLRPVVPGKNLNVQMYGPRNVHALVKEAGDVVNNNNISIGMAVQYADAVSEDQQPWEEVTIAVDFKWSENTRSWVPGGLRIINVRQLQ